MKKVAFLSCSDLTGFIVDDQIAIDQLKSHGVDTDVVPWENAECDWAQYQAVVIRSTWNYHKRTDEFLKALESISAQTLLLNSWKTVQANFNKTYLKELAAKGLPIVETKFYREIKDVPGEAPFETDELIVKPVISGGAYQTFRILREEWKQKLLEIRETFPPRVEVMVQAFIPSVIDKGEVSLFYFNGEFSHAIQKVPKPGDFRVQEEFGGDITPFACDEDIKALGQSFVEAHFEDLLFARVDLVQDNGWKLMELELIEPALYFRTVEGSAENFSQALLKHLS